MPKQLITKEFIEKARYIHKNTYDYSNVKYINTYTSVNIICPIHGSFSKIPKEHLQGSGCILCGRNNTQKSNEERKLTLKKFIDQANVVHNYKYAYSLVEYKNAHTKVKIICKEHGTFLQTPANHMHGGDGCPICYAESGNRGGCYTKNFFEKYPDIANASGILYFVEFKNIEEHFVKVGITKHSIQKRFRDREYKKYTLTPLYQKIGLMYQIYEEEQHIIKKYKTFKYKPLDCINGSRECFLYDINLIVEVKKFFR